MITRETILTAMQPRDPEPSSARPTRLVPCGPGWITDGRWMARTELAPPEDVGPWKNDPTKHAIGTIATASVLANLVPVVEDPKWRISMRTDVKCPECGGAGKCNDCRCGTEHDCGACDGASGRIEDIGQAVYVAPDGVETMLSDKFARMLDGLRVFRLNEPTDETTVTRLETDDPRALLPLVGWEGDELVLVAMPLRINRDGKRQPGCEKCSDHGPCDEHKVKP